MRGVLGIAIPGRAQDFLGIWCVVSLFKVVSRHGFGLRA